jgi:predicted transcriptional regulator
VSHTLSYISGKIPLRGVENPLEEKIMSRNKYRQLNDHICISVPVIHEGPKQTPLGPIQALIYGYLVFRSRKNRAASKTGISRVLRLDRAAVAKALQSLEMLGLVLADDKLRWSAVEPAGNARDLFRFRTECNGEWQSRFVYDRVYLPCSSSMLSVKANLLFWRLYKLGKPVQSMPGYLQIGGHADCPVRFLTMVYLAKSVRCHRTTISSGLKRLARHGLITIHAIEGMSHKHAFAVGIPPIANRLDLWRKKQQHTNASIVVTAQQLFGVPSAMTVAPEPANHNDPESILVAHHFPSDKATSLL